MKPTVRYALLVMSGFLLVQAAWILAVPPFRGSDEFDHAFRASGVAAGQWRLTETAQHGRGMIVAVPDDLVAAASAQCTALKYTGPDNCRPIRTHPGGIVEIATAAGNYNPLFYWPVGMAGQAFHGATSLYAMRIAASVLCALGVFIAALAIGGMTSRRWVRLGFLASLTPVLCYSTSLPAPNGVEMMCGLVLWTSLLAVTSPHRDPGRDRWLLVAATGAAVLLTFVRLLGPLWLLLILASVAMFRGWAGVQALLTEHLRHVVVTVFFVAAATAGAAAWITTTGGYGVSTADRAPASIGIGAAFQVPVWILQMVAAFPTRAESAPSLVYFLVLLVVLVLLISGAWKSTGITRVSIIAAVVGSLALPIVLTLATMSGRGAIWQGRYELPFVVGIPVACGIVMDRTGFARQHFAKVAVPSVVMLAVAQILSVVKVLTTSLGQAPSSTDASWVHPPAFLLGLLMALAWVPLGASVLLRSNLDEPVETPPKILSGREGPG